MKYLSSWLALISVLVIDLSQALAQSPNPTGGQSNSPTPTGGQTNSPTPTGGQSGTGVSIQNPLGEQTITGFFTSLIEVILILAVPVIVFFIIYSGFLYVTAQGNSDKVKDAHRALLYTIIGALLILGAFVILEVIEGTVDAFRV